MVRTFRNTFLNLHLIWKINKMAALSVHSGPSCCSWDAAVKWVALRLVQWNIHQIRWAATLPKTTEYKQVSNMLSHLEGQRIHRPMPSHHHFVLFIYLKMMLTPLFQWPLYSFAGLWWSIIWPLGLAPVVRMLNKKDLSTTLQTCHHCWLHCKGLRLQMM